MFQQNTLIWILYLIRLWFHCLLSILRVWLMRTKFLRHIVTITKLKYSGLFVPFMGNQGNHCLSIRQKYILAGSSSSQKNRVEDISNTYLLRQRNMRTGSQMERAANGSKLSDCPTFMESRCEEMLGKLVPGYCIWKRSSVKSSSWSGMLDNICSVHLQKWAHVVQM